MKRERQTHLGRYELIREIGRGGMGVIFEGRDTRDGRRVALKVLPATGANDTERLKRFTREIQTISMLAHPGIVRIFDVGEDHGRHFYAMEYVEGSSVKDLVAEEGMALRRGLELIEQVCRALAHVHRKGVVHRDINPANILVDGEGRPILIDFGIAKLQDTSRLTRAGATVGTPRYLSPEQALGEPDVDERTDVYGLGATLYLIATGRAPFSEQGGQTVSLMALEAGPAAPSLVNARVPREVEQIIRTAMARKRDDRYRSTMGMATDIRSYLDTGRLALARRRLPPVALAALGTALALVLGVSVFVLFGFGGERARGGPGGGRPVTGPGPGATPTPPRSAEGARLLAEAEAQLASGRAGEAVRTFTNALAHDAPPGPSHLGLARAHARLENPQAALEACAIARADASLARAADALEGELLAALVPPRLAAGDLTQALPWLDRWLAVAPEAAGRVAWPAVAAADAAAKLPGFANLASAAGDSPATAYAAAAYGLRAQAKADEARAALEKVVNHAPTFAAAWRALAGCRARAGEHVGAVAALRESHRLAPGTEVGADAFVILHDAREDDAAGRIRSATLAALGPPGPETDLAFAEAVLDAYAARADALGVMLASDDVFRLANARADGGAAVIARAEQVLTQHQRAWERAPLEALPSEVDRRLRRAMRAASGTDAEREAALADLAALLAAEPRRARGSVVHRTRAVCSFNLKRYDDCRGAVELTLERDPTEPTCRQLQCWFLLQGTDAAAAQKAVDQVVTAAREADVGRPNAVLRRIAYACERPLAGVTAWLTAVRQWARADGRPDALAEAAQAAARHPTAIRQIGPAPAPVALYAAAVALLEPVDAGAATQALTEAATRVGEACPAGADGGGPARVAGGVCELLREMLGSGTVTTEGAWPILRPLWAAVARWDLAAVPAPVRAETWGVMARAALAARLPGRTLLALDRAVALGTPGASVAETRTRAEAELPTGACAHDAFVRGERARAAKQSKAAKEAYDTALKRAEDGSLLPEERAALEKARKAIR